MANSFAEKWAATARPGCLDHLLIVGRRHLPYALKDFVEHYQDARLDAAQPKATCVQHRLAGGLALRTGL